MNRKDMKELGRKSAAKNTANDTPYNTPYNTPYKTPEKMTREQAWFTLYAAAIGGHTGWLLSGINDQDTFERRLNTLSDIATAALNYAIREKKIKVTSMKSEAKNV